MSHLIFLVLFTLNLIFAASTFQYSWVKLGAVGLPGGGSGFPGIVSPELYALAAGSIRISCDLLPGLSPGQQKFCLLYEDHMPSVARGAQIGILECQHVFAGRRWNCSIGDREDVFGPVIHRPSREKAFTNAITAAGVVHSVAKSCRGGFVRTCGCSRAPRPKRLHRDWMWGGCGDNVEYGYRFAEGFVDVREREHNYVRGTLQQGIQLMNLHNNEAGRRSVYNMAKVACKCHGVSGSCSLKTCWQSLAPFRLVSNWLKQRYDGATKVKINRKGRLQLADPKVRLPTGSDLVYMEDSPDYCSANDVIGSRGTTGRACNQTSAAMNGCDLLCCGRGYNTHKVEVSARCRCKFHWCCYVKCDTCVEEKDLHTCK